MPSYLPQIKDTEDKKEHRQDKPEQGPQKAAGHHWPAHFAFAFWFSRLKLLSNAGNIFFFNFKKYVFIACPAWARWRWLRVGGRGHWPSRACILLRAG